MNRLKSHFTFTKIQRSGIFILCGIIICLQLLIFKQNQSTSNLVHEELELRNYQLEIDSLRNLALQHKKPKQFPYNPNFISDYKGYVLGMTAEELDRLHAFRKKNKFVNSAKEFQAVTLVSDSLLKIISKDFKFPDWVTNKHRKNSSYGIVKEMQDINTCSAQELQKIFGVGEKLSSRIIKFRAALGGFISTDQLHDVYGLSPELIVRIEKRFEVVDIPELTTIDVNTASVEDLTSLVYINYQLALNIVEYRTLRGRIVKLQELNNVDGFPKNKFERIKVYLSIK